MAKHTFSIVPRGSFSWPSAFDVLTRFQPLAHVWTGDASDLRLSLLSDGDFAPVDVRLRFEGGVLRGESTGGDVARQVARIFSLDHDGTEWDALCARERRLGALVPGLRPVCFTSPYEAACWGIVSQHISMDQGARVIATLVEESGGRFPAPSELIHLERLRGLAAVKVERLRAVAAAALDGGLDADRLRALGEEGALESLRRIPGIGPFWSKGIYLRACGVTDVFPDEPRALAALEKLYGDRNTDRFRPFRMWACFLLRVADARGLITPSTKSIRTSVRTSTRSDTPARAVAS